MIRFVQSLLIALFVAVASLPAMAQSDAEVSKTLDSLFGDHKPYQAFLAELQKAVAAADKPAVAGLIGYPLKTKVAGKATTLHNAQEFTAHYDALMTAKITGAVKGQAYGKLFANAQGVMIGDGEIWFSGICSDTACSKQAVKVIAINQ
jgi:hypothetical protein